MNKSSGGQNKGNNFTTESNKYKNVTKSQSSHNGLLTKRIITQPNTLSMATPSEWSLNTIIIRNDSGTFNFDTNIHFGRFTNDTNAGIGIDNNTIASDAVNNVASVVNITTGNITSTRVGTNTVVVGSSGNGSTDVNIENLENYKYWSEIVLIICFCLFIIITVIGNTLVILSVITTRRLRTVTNCFVMSLAVADWLVGVFVMPPAVAVYVMGT